MAFVWFMCNFERFQTENLQTEVLETEKDHTKGTMNKNVWK